MSLLIELFRSVTRPTSNYNFPVMFTRWISCRHENKGNISCLLNYRLTSGQLKEYERAVLKVKQRHEFCPDFVPSFDLLEVSI